MKTVLIGSVYDPKIESDILLLDISDDEGYIWTNFFKSSISIPVVLFMGYLIIGILLFLVGLILHKRNSNRAKPNPEDVGDNDDDENLVIPIRGNTNDYGTADQDRREVI